MSRDFIIIDGYNLLRSVGFIRGGIGPGTLLRARQSLLGFLARFQDPESRHRTTVVFDAKSAPDLEDEQKKQQQIVHDIQVLFATDHDEADDLIEQLIRRHSAPKQLTVVSSDHRLQTAAKRRNAKFISSQDWFELLQANAAHRPPDSESEEPAGTQKLTAEETARWLEQFNLEAESADQRRAGSTTENAAAESMSEESESLPDYDPFPAGYGEDLLDDPEDSS